MDKFDLFYEDIPIGKRKVARAAIRRIGSSRDGFNINFRPLYRLVERITNLRSRRFLKK